MFIRKQASLSSPELALNPIGASLSWCEALFLTISQILVFQFLRWLRLKAHNFAYRRIGFRTVLQFVVIVCYLAVVFVTYESTGIKPVLVILFNNQKADAPFEQSQGIILHAFIIKIPIDYLCVLLDFFEILH